ncbi:MAG: hypothetical protein ACI9UA_003069, partial [Pseudoalteromonas tetraodonis]
MPSAIYTARRASPPPNTQTERSRSINQIAEPRPKKSKKRLAITT